MLKKGLFILAALLVLPAFPTDGSAGWNPLKKDSAKKEKSDQAKVDEAIRAFREKDADMEVFFDEAHGYAVFPSVGKGGIGFGGAYGRGRVYEQGKFIGRTSLTQATIGFQLGGQAYREIIFFKDKRALDDFAGGNFEFSAQASAVAVTAGAAADVDYDDGVAVFILPKGGLMYEASIGGQKFSFDAE